MTSPRPDFYLKVYVYLTMGIRWLLLAAINNSHRRVGRPLVSPRRSDSLLHLFAKRAFQL